MKNLKFMAGWLTLFLLAYILVRLGVKEFPEIPIRWEILTVIGVFASMIIIIFASVMGPSAAKATVTSFWFLLLFAGIYFLPISQAFVPDILETWIIRAGFIFPVVMFVYNLVRHLSLIKKKQEEPVWTALGLQAALIIAIFVVMEKIILPMM